MLTVRPFRADDLDDLYDISLATGEAGGDGAHLYVDPKLIGHIYSAPYARLEPQLALVVEDEQGVAGFVVGTADTSAWKKRRNASGGRRYARNTPCRPRRMLRHSHLISDGSSRSIGR